MTDLFLEHTAIRKRFPTPKQVFIDIFEQAFLQGHVIAVYSKKLFDEDSVWELRWRSRNAY